MVRHDESHACMNRVLLNNVDHAHLRVARRAGAAFGDAVNQVPVFPSEFEQLQREFPIVFRATDDGIDAFVLTGLDRDENLFLDEDRWTSRYVPAVQRRGPFSVAIARPGATEPGGDSSADDLMIHVDLDDARVGADDGLPMFLEQGGNAPYLDEIGDVLRIIFDGMRSARAIHARLQEFGLLQPVTIQIDVDDSTRYDVPDLLVVAPQALAGLSGAPLETLHREGLLQLAMMASSSLGTVPDLIARKTRRRDAR